MRTTFPFGSRPMPWDRNPQAIRQSAAIPNLAPHAATIRWSYTVPTGRKAILNHIFLMLMRASAPTTNGRVQGLIRITPSGGSALTVLSLHLFPGNVGEVSVASSAPQTLLSAGDTVDYLTADGSTGGGVDYVGAALLTEFDA